MVEVLEVIQTFVQRNGCTSETNSHPLIANELLRIGYYRTDLTLPTKPGARVRFRSLAQSDCFCEMHTDVFLNRH